jgi:D-alanyl-D-alanine carboxypeptidase
MMALKRVSKKGLVILTLLLLFLINPVQANPLHASIVIDANTGEVLHALHADASRYPASLTKMMTLYMLFEALKQGKLTLDTRMRTSAHAASMPSTNINLQTGDSIRVRDAIPALIVRSANDVATVVAETLGGTEANFSRMMTDKASKLGMSSTTFRNASGLPSNEQKTTARDMATLSTRLMKDFPQHYHYFSTQSFTYKGITYNSHNRMVRNTHGVDGLKTGFIRAAGFNVATSAKRGNRRVIAVVMGGTTAAFRDQQMAQLLDRSFTREAPVVAQKVSTSTPAFKPISAQKKTPAPAVIPETPQTKNNVESQKVAMHNKSWEVQIGSYLAHERAQAQAQAATRWIPGAVVITEVEISERKL